MVLFFFPLIHDVLDFSLKLVRKKCLYFSRSLQSFLEPGVVTFSLKVSFVSQCR